MSAGAPAWRRGLALAAAHPHDFTIQYPPSRRYFREHFAAPLDPRGASDLEDAAVYFHVPFCAHRCFYCNFAVDLRKRPATHARYVDALIAQSQRLRDATGDLSVWGLDVGGGTPTLLRIDLLERVIAEVGRWRDRIARPGPSDWSIETTPHIAATEPDKLAVLRAGGVRRISVGLQSTSDRVLAEVNRRLQRSVGQAALRNLRDAGFERVSVDLVFGLPGQTPQHLRDDLAQVLDLGADAVTIYDCLYRGEDRALPGLTDVRPTPGDYGRMYDAAFALLADRGLQAPYGALNFSRHAAESGVSDYFEARLLGGRPMLGLGNYASSLVGDRWWFAPHGVDAYADAIEGGALLPAQDAYALPAGERMAKHVLFALSFGHVPHQRFAQLFGVPFTQAFADPLAHAVARGWLAVGADETTLVQGAFRHMPAIRSLFYTPGAIRFVEARHAAPIDARQPSAVPSRA